jgi:hypothetical protein
MADVLFISLFPKHASANFIRGWCPSNMMTWMREGDPPKSVASRNVHDCTSPRRLWLLPVLLLQLFPSGFFLVPSEINMAGRNGNSKQTQRPTAPFKIKYFSTK